jgi:hypothetical protein
MISFLKRRNRSEYEGTVWSDIRALFGRGAQINWKAALLALAIPTVIATAFIMETMDGVYQEPEITYIKSYAPGRTDAEIKAQQAKDMAAEKVEDAKAAVAEEARKAEFRKLADLFGVDEK